MEGGQGVSHPATSRTNGCEAERVHHVHALTEDNVILNPMVLRLGNKQAYVLLGSQAFTNGVLNETAKRNTTVPARICRQLH